MPDLLWIHFHGIDDAGHTHGPGASAEQAAVAGVDAAVGEVLATLPSRTLVLVFADHGMHAVEEGDRSGNHGHLIARDMLVPIWSVHIE
jgi:predicted AlkP superfamily pyrophosphatase or phosphodiesterase